MDYSESSYEELEREYNRVTVKYHDKQEESLKKGLTWDEFCVKAKDEKKAMYFIDKYMRLKMVPTISFNEEIHGEQFTLEEFKKICTESNLYTDSDGFGYYASDKGISDIKVYPSDFVEKIYREDFPNIIWYNK